MKIGRKKAVCTYMYLYMYMYIYNYSLLYSPKAYIWCVCSPKACIWCVCVHMHSLSLKVLMYTCLVSYDSIYCLPQEILQSEAGRGSRGDQ